MRVVSIGRTEIAYGASLAGLVGFVGVVLLTLVELRRGILLAAPLYVKVGAPSAFAYLHPMHALLLVVGFAGSWQSYRFLRQREREAVGSGLDLHGLRNLLAGVLLGMLIVDLFVYRGVQAARIASSGRLGISMTFPLEALPWWARPVGEAVNYLLVVWHATVLGLLIGALLLVLLHGSDWGTTLRSGLSRRGLPAHLAGSLMAVPYPFCSCCAAPIGAALFRSGVSLEATLAFLVGAPMLNLTTLSLAAVLLPPRFALLRIGGGLLLAVLGTYLVARALPSAPAAPHRTAPWMERLVALFVLERGLARGQVRTPGDLMEAWLRTTWRLARVVVPVLFVTAILTGVLSPFIVSFLGANDPLSVAKAAAAGTLLMVPTWTELAVAAPLIHKGLSGPAAALLLTLPAYSVPCLVILGSALRDYRPAVLLAVVVFLFGLVAGMLWLV